MASTRSSSEAHQAAFEYQRDNVCFSFVEVLSTCPTNWGLSPTEADTWLENTMIPYYPLGVFKQPGVVTPPVTGGQA
jgi:2-oxoglutarate ferredoxin oxidoreductase subunit beta